MRNHFCSFSLLLSIFVVGCATDAPVGTVEWIVDGEATSNEERAVVLVFNRRGGLCTGTIIAPRIVLTAKHCVQSPGATEPSDASAFVVGVGDTSRGLSETFDVSAVSTPPGVYSDRGGLSGALVGIDIATLTLTRGTTITPIPIHRESSARVVGQTMRSIGFGQTPSGGAGRKFRTTTRVSGVMGGVIYTPPTICQGDSGGPLLTMTDDGEEVIGVASFGSGACGSGINGFNRVDVLLELVDAAVADSGACLNDGEERCDGYDNDCDDQVDEDCNEVGEGCTVNEDCITLLCERTDAGRICTSECDAVRPFVGCPPSFYCGEADGCTGLCIPGSAGELGVDEDCEENTDCYSLNCMDPGDGRKRCLDPCQGDGATCLDGEVCAASPGACGGCVPQNIVGATRGYGEPCDEDADCNSGTCFMELDAGYCSRECGTDADCGDIDRFHCREDICVRGAIGRVGDGCVSNEDCAETLFCAARGEDRWCTQFCSDSECPEGFACEMAGGASVCAPERGVIGSPCETGDDCLSSVCLPLGPEGELLCSRQCGPESTCAPGYTCVRDTAGRDAVCAPTEEAPEPPADDGGCSVSFTGRAPAGLLLFLMFFFTARQRRSRRSFS